MRIFLLLILSLNFGLSKAQVNPSSSFPSEDCSNGLDDDGDGYIDCYDIDCQCSNPPDCATLVPPNTGISMNLAWKSQPLPYSPVGITMVGNLNPQTDDMPEILLPYNGTWDEPMKRGIMFYRGDGSNANAPDTMHIFELHTNSPPPVIGDVDGDGVPEIILVENDFYLRVYRNFTPGNKPAMSHWITSAQRIEFSNSAPMLADMDGDGTPEVIVGNEIFIFDFTGPGSPALRKVIDGGTNPAGYIYNTLPSNFSQHTKSPAVADLLSPADCNGDPDCNGLELVAGPVIYSIDLDTMDGDGYEIKIVRDLNVMESPNVFGDGYTAVADMNIDGTPDIVVIGRGKVGLDPAALGVYVWNKNGLVRFMPTPLGDVHEGYLYCLPMIANVFDDTKRGLAKDFPEIVMCTSTTLYCFNLHATNFPDLQAWWFLNLGFALFSETSATAFDFNGDGFSEIVFPDEGLLRIIYGGHFPFPAGVDGNRNWATFPMHTQGQSSLYQYPVVADVDNDGQAEIAVAGGPDLGSGFSSELHVFQSGGIPWPSCRNLWNQFNYNIVNVDDDLGIPVQQQQQWKEFPAPGSGKRPLNMALGQRGPLNGTVYLPLADVRSGVDTFYCDKDSLRLRLRVCNQGSASSPAGLSLQWYQGNPTTAGATPYGAPYSFPSVIAKDSCAFWNLAVPLPPNGALYGIINDNGSLSGPIDLATDFPSTTLLECDYVDNLFFINVSYSTPTLNLGPDQSVCKDATLLLTANSGFSRYRWQDGSENMGFTAQGIGKYWVDAWDICGNLFSDTLQLLAIPTPPLVLGSDQSLCLGDSLTLAVSGFDNVDWASSGNTICANCPSFTLMPDTDLTILASGQSGVCFERDTIFIQVLPLPQIIGQVEETQCGNANGAISLMVNSALLYQIQWSGGQTGAMLSGLPAATYTVTVTDDAGCSESESYSVAGSTAVVLDAPILNHILCFGEQTGAISVSLNSGTAPYQYNWSTGLGSYVLNGLAAGGYILTVTDDLGCSVTEVFQITEAAPLSIQSTVDGTSCISTTGDISVTPQGGTQPYVFAWDNGQNTPTLNDLPPGTYTVLVTDANGCETAQSFDIDFGGTPQISDALVGPVLCFGGNTGAISVNVTLGVQPYQYNWSSGSGSDSIDNLGAGAYTVTITDANGCSTTNQYLITEPPLLTLQSNVDSTSCISITGDILVIPQGGIQPYLFAWGGGQSTSTLNDLPPGTYNLTVSDANGCKTIQTFDIEIGGSPVFSDSLLLPVRCNADNTGAIEVSVTQGVMPYQFNWSTGSGSGSLNNLAAGTYSVTATDANGCSATAQFSLGQPNALSLLAEIDSTSCTSSTGDISVSGQGGTAPFAYTWNGGQNTPTLSDLNPGTYTVTISDANGCTLQQAFALAPGGAPILADSEILPVTCFGETNGQITVDVNGGVAPYQFQWSTGSTVSLLSNLSAGDYTFTATGANGCFTTVQFSVAEPALLSLSALLDSTSCTSNTGNITATPQGGALPYIYLWSSGQNTAVVNGLLPGDYTLTVTDSNGCTTADTYSVLPGGTPELTNSMVTPVTCFGGSNGEINIVAAGGLMPYQFSWSIGSGGNTLNNLPAGTYDLTLTDANTCSLTTTFIVETPASIETGLTAVSDTCGQSTGSIAVNTNGGIAPYTFLWSDGQTTENLIDLSAGTLQLTVTDANGCTILQSAEVFSIDILPAFTLSGDTITCAQPVVQGAPNPAPQNWVFQWQAPDGNLLSGAVQNLSLPGQYSVTAINNFGCTVVHFLDIPVDTLTPQAIAAAKELFVPCDQSVVILDGSGSSASSSIVAHWYQENNGQLVWDTISILAQTNLAGTFILQITDTKNGCMDYDTVQVTVAEPIAGVMIDLDLISCFGLENGAIRAETVLGGTAPYLYALGNQAFSPTFEFTGLSAGTYTLSVQDANGCDWQSAALLIGEPAPLSLDLTVSDTRIDLGESVLLQAQVQPPGAVLSQVYWSPPEYFSLPDSLTETAQPTESTLFQIEVEDNNGCITSDTVRVTVRKEDIYVPNIFQPGSLDNDAFTVFAGSDILQVQLFRVYDRWGEHLFENRHFPPNDPAQGWDGGFRGKTVAPGVYIFYLVVEMADGRTIEITGNVTVVQ